MRRLRGKYLMVLIATCGMMAAAPGMLTNIAGVFFTPISEELGIGRGTVSMTLTISNLIFALAGMFVTKAYTSRSFKQTLAVGGIGFAASTALLSLSPNIFVLYAVNAVRGFAGGMVGNVIASILINNWFRQNLGLVTSIAMGCSGISGALFSPILTAVIGASNWRMGYVVAGGIILLMELPAMLLPISLDPRECGLAPLGGDTRSAAKQEAAVPEPVPKTVFALLMLFGLFTSFLSAYPQHFPGISGGYGFTAAIGSAMLSVALVANTGGKLAFGALADRFGASITARVYAVLVAAGYLLLLLSSAAPMFAGAALAGLSYSLPTVGIVLVTKDAGGPQNYTRLLPKVNLVASISNALGTSIIGYIYDAAQSYAPSLILGCIVCAGTFCVVSAIYLRRVRA